MSSTPTFFEKLFPGQEIPPEFRGILSMVPLSEEALLKASPSKLTPPFSLPGMKELVSELTQDLTRGAKVYLRTKDSGDQISARALFSAIYNKHRKQITYNSSNKPDLFPVLDLTHPDGIRYLKSRDTSSPFLPAVFDSGHYAVSGLIFKLGEAELRSKETDFGKSYVAFDLETTGKNYRNDDIIEIGAVKIKDGKLGEEFNALVKPPRPIPPEITNLTGITNDEVKKAPPIQYILPSFLDFIGGSILVAHNIEFDYPFLNHVLKKHLNRKLHNETFCTLVQARSRMPGQSHRLGDVARALGIEMKDWHRAISDAKTAGLIFLNFMEEDKSPKHYAYFRNHVARAGLGTWVAGIPLLGDNAVFFRYGLPDIISDFIVGKKYFQKYPDKKPPGVYDLVGFLNSWMRKKRGQAVYRILALSFPAYFTPTRPGKHVDINK